MVAGRLNLRRQSTMDMYGTPIFGNIVVYVSKPINNNNKIIWRHLNTVRFDIPSVIFTSKAGLSIFCCIPCMEETFVGLIYNKLLDLNEEDLSLHTSQTV